MEKWNARKKLKKSFFAINYFMDSETFNELKGVGCE
jgi:hypothetical protein